MALATIVESSSRKKRDVRFDRLGRVVLNFAAELPTMKFSTRIWLLERYYPRPSLNPEAERFGLDPCHCAHRPEAVGVYFGARACCLHMSFQVSEQEPSRRQRLSLLRVGK